MSATPGARNGATSHLGHNHGPDSHPGHNPGHGAHLPMASGSPSPSSAGHPFPGHTRIATLMADDAGQVVSALRHLGPETDAAEIRLDGLWKNVPTEDAAADDLLALTEATTKPLIATLRPVRQGGRFDGPEDVRIGLLAAALRAGFACVDLEADTADVPGVVAALQGEGNLLLSHHEPRTPSCDEAGRLLISMQDQGAAFDKLAFAASSFADTLRALEVTRKHALRGAHPAIATTGVGGAPLRALLALAGNRSTYGHAPGLAPAAPGQPALADVQALWDHWGLTKADLDAAAERPAPWLAVLGIPVVHSLSPRLHNHALRHAGRPERFGALEVPASAAALRLTSMVAKRIGLVGASVTMPHKADAIRMGPADNVAKAVGAANCLRWRGEEPEATNTDATALHRLLKPHVDANAPAVVIGAGGAARAAIWALRDLGAVVRFTSRDPVRARAVAAALGAKWTPWDERNELAGQVWVQATPLGTGAPSPVAASQLRGAPLVVEMVYKGGPTPFQLLAQAAGCPVVDGRTLLLEQAVDAYRFWFDAEPDRAAMAQALGPA